MQKQVQHGAQRWGRACSDVGPRWGRARGACPGPLCTWPWRLRDSVDALTSSFYPSKLLPRAGKGRPEA